MEDRVAIEVLKKLISKYSLEGEEVEAVKTAIGILAWSKLMEGYVNRKKKRRDERLREDD